MALGLRSLREAGRVGNGRGCGWIFLGMVALLIGVLVFGALASTCGG